MTSVQAVALVLASVAAGAMNSIAGGGTLLSFPAALAVGLSPIVANASNSVAMTPASLASAWAYRRELRQDKHVLRFLVIPALLGGVAGSLLLLVTPQSLFDAIVPLLILLATGLLLFQNIRAPQSSNSTNLPWVLPANKWMALGIQFLVGVYGGYFGAGMGIMVLAMLTMLGGKNIHRMNGVKIVLGAVVNGFASACFLIARAVDLPATILMTIGATLGGYGGASLARRVNTRTVRWIVVAIGLGLSAIFAYRKWL